VAEADTSTRIWQARDSDRYLHPFTDHAALRRRGARIVTHADGVYVWDTDGNKVLDGLAGLGCVNIGYGRAELVRAAAEQMQRLSFCQSFFNTSNQPAIRLAETLIDIAPAGLEHVFFQSSGSEANETAARLIRKYWQLSGRPEKRIIIARENAYHGSTMLAASLSGLPPMHEAGGDLPLPNIAHIKAPYHYRHGPAMPADVFGKVAAGWLEEAIVALGPDSVAAFFAEPLQGAGGAIIPPDSYWPEIQRICRKHDVLLAVDEVVSGFGRTGAWFGCDTYGITPDVMQVAKGLTSAYAPLSATLMSGRIGKTLIDKGGEWYHGFTYSGHPTCCAVALENIRILRDERIIETVHDELAPHFAAHVAALADHPAVGDVRSCGLLAGIELVADKAERRLFDEARGVGEACSAFALDHGLALRSIGDTMALMPPLVITRSQLDFVFEVTRASLDHVAQQFLWKGDRS
jgi:putrescine aminotransferase